MTRDTLEIIGGLIFLFFVIYWLFGLREYLQQRETNRRYEKEEKLKHSKMGSRKISEEEFNRQEEIFKREERQAIREEFGEWEQDIELTDEEKKEAEEFENYTDEIAPPEKNNNTDDDDLPF